MENPEKKAFDILVGRFADRLSAELLADSAVEPGSSSPFEVLRRFQVDLRAQSIWEWLRRDEAATDSFLEAVQMTLIDFWFVDKITFMANRRALVYAEALQAMEATLQCCKKLRQLETDGDPEWSRLPKEFEEQLLFAAQRIANKTQRDREIFDRVLPSSRKAAPEFMKRVHFPSLLVGQMGKRFGRPLFQQVADATTILFELKNPLSANSVRKAWTRHGFGPTQSRLLADGREHLRQVGALS